MRERKLVPNHVPPLQGPLPLPGRGPLVKQWFPSAVAAPEAAVHDVDSQTPLPQTC